jgi:Sec-independent protein translocase protein TatA
MFALTAGEIIVLGFVAFAVIGPRSLPAILRAIGRFIGRMRR